MNNRTWIFPALSLALFACAPGDEVSVPAATVVPLQEQGRVFAFAPSPDGTRMAWAGSVDGRSAIYVGGLDGSDPVRLTYGVWDYNPRWSPDGTMIAYGTEEGWNIRVVPSTGGEFREVTSGPARDRLADWLPDGSGVVVWREGVGAAHTVAVPLDGGPERRIGPEVAGDQYVAPSPDGSMLAYLLLEGGGGTIWVQANDGSAPRQLTSEGLEGVETAQVWSPDGTRLLYTSRRTGTTDLWIAEVATGELRQLTSDLRNDVDYAWSPDGRWVLFESDRGGQWDLWIVPSEGGPPRRVTNDRDREDRAVWSADGAAVFYTSYKGESALQLLPISGGAPRELFRWPSVEVSHARISPDGATAVFSADRLGAFDLWQQPLAGGEPTPLVTGPLTEEQPSYSPDGSSVVFTSNRGGSRDIWLVPAAGGDPVRLTDWPSRESGPRWSPDGSLIAFLSNHQAASSSQVDLWVVPPIGGEPRRVTRFGGTIWNVLWSPDGQALYFFGESASGERDLYRVAVAGGEPEPLGADPEGDRADLSPDGTHLVYTVFRGGWAFTEVIPSAGGPRRRLTTDTTAVYQFGANWSVDGSRIFVRDQDLVNIGDRILEVTWPDAVWRPVTAKPPGVATELHQVSPDGEHLLVVEFPFSWRIMSTPVAELLADH